MINFEFNPSPLNDEEIIQRKDFKQLFSEYSLQQKLVKRKKYFKYTLIGGTLIIFSAFSWLYFKPVELPQELKERHFEMIKIEYKVYQPKLEIPKNLKPYHLQLNTELVQNNVNKNQDDAVIYDGEQLSNEARKKQIPYLLNEERSFVVYDDVKKITKAKLLINGIELPERVRVADVQYWQDFTLVQATDNQVITFEEIIVLVNAETFVLKGEHIPAHLRRALLKVKKGDEMDIEIKYRNANGELCVMSQKFKIN